jgi:ubiquitin-like 1-activating enzyme E1 B
MSIKELWTSREPPVPLDFKYTGVFEKDFIKKEQEVWTIEESITVFVDSLRSLNNRFMESGDIEFEKDDDEIMDFVASATNLRARIFGIDTQTRFNIKCRY